MNRELFNRIISATILVPPAITSIILGGIWLTTLFSVAATLMLAEWIKISHTRLPLLTSGVVYIVGAMVFWMVNPNYQWLLLFIMPLVWSVDVGAYIGGKLIGGAKLVPSISPNKTWAGAITGFLSAMLAYLVYIKICHWIPTYTNFFITVFCAVLAILGDLLESKIKRILKIKDSGTLIPGHGGILDRLDSFLAVSWGLAFLSAFK